MKSMCTLIATSLVLASLTTLSLTGCGGGDEPAPAGSSAGSTATPLTAEQAAANPLKGSTAGDADDLLGTWFCITDGPFTGLEFLENKKVLVSASILGITQGADGVMMSYDIIDGGRLTLTGPMGQTHVFATTMSGDQLQLKDSQGETHRYRLLPKGQTLTQAVRELQQAKMEVFQKQIQQLQAWLDEGKLVMTVKTDVIPEMLVVAIQPQKQPGDTYNGFAWQQQPSPSLANATIKLVPNERTMTTRLQVTLSQQIAPAVSRPTATAGSFMLETNVDANGRVTATGPLSIGNRQAQAELAQNESRHDAIVKSYEDLMAAREAIRQPLIDALRDYAVLEGTAQVPNQANQQTRDTITLVRSPGETPRWQGQISSVNTTTGQATSSPVMGAGVMVENDKAVLVVPGSSRQYQLALDGKLKGQWMMGGRNMGGAEFEITQAMDKAAHDAMLKQLEEKLLAIKPEMNLQGFAPVNGPRDEKTPVVANITLHEGGKVTANIHYTMFKSLVTMEGSVTRSLTGPAIELRFKDIPAGQQDVRVSANMLSMKIRNQRWTLQPADTGPLMLLDASLSSPGGGFQLVNADATFKAKHDTMLKNMLSQGVKLYVAHPARDNVEPTIINLKLDEATGKVTGDIPAGGRHLAIRIPAALEGKLQDIGPWSGLTLTAQEASVRRQHAFELIVLEVDGKPSLNGVFYPVSAPQAEKYVQLQQVSE